MRWIPPFLHFLSPVALWHRKSRRPAETTVAPAVLRGLTPTCLAPVGYLPRSRSAGELQPHHAVAGGTTPGLHRLLVEKPGCTQNHAAGTSKACSDRWKWSTVQGREPVCPSALWWRIRAI